MSALRIAMLTTDGRDMMPGWAERPMPSFGTAPEALLQGFAGMEDLEVHVISCARQPIRAPVKLADNIFFHSVVVPRIGWIRTGYQGCIRAVRKKLREIRPDIVHGQGTERDCAICAVFSGFPNVLTIHGNMRLIAQLERPKAFSFVWLAAKLESLTIPRSDGVVCITRYTEKAMKNRARQTWLLPNAVDETFFGSQTVPDCPPMVLCVGNVCPRKNQNEFIQALDSLAKRLQIKVIFLGQASKDDEYGKEFFRLVETRPWCSYEGYASRDRLKTYFERATLLALPSLEDNCPMVVLEAMAAGVSVIAANVGGVPDLIENGKTGLLCDPLNRKSICTAVTQIIEDPRSAQAMVSNAKQQARERYHPKQIARQHLKIYGEVLRSEA